MFDEDKIDPAIYSLGELQQHICVMEESAPKDKRTKQFKAYVDELNSLFEVYNGKAGEKIYRKIKL